MSYRVSLIIVIALMTASSMAFPVHAQQPKRVQVSETKASDSPATHFFSTPDQQGQRLLERGDARAAARAFMSPAHKGYAALQARQYQAAVDSLSGLSDSRSLYNKGNALAHLQRFKQAIDAYNQAIKADANNRDAVKNRDIVKKMLKAQQQQSQQQQSQQQQSQQQQSQQQQSQQQQSQQQQPLQQQPLQQQPLQQRQDRQPHQREEALPKTEAQIARAQWLKQIHSNPADLLKNKLRHEYLQRSQRGTK